MKKALLVGINRYPDPGNELKGCVNDVRQMADTLKSRYGFPGDGSLRILTDARATTKAILDGLAWLTAGASPGDSLVFHFSGHGSQVPDRNGDETSDRLDEILCPYDLDWDHPLTDDDLAAACADVPPGALLTVILDCCHSGTGLRDFAPDRRRFLPHPEAHRSGLN
ncbi:caspase family protein, partial [Candidatus Deferrimicrobium sp.]|uniref:caspase family protein n=1 Tax=Candidatus Deferrimicrobium sp. TaxID=3060586 RepID=UPI003C3C7B39